MYVRKQKDHKGRYYLTVCDGVKVDGKTRTKYIRKIGYLDELTTAEIPDPLSYYRALIKQETEELKEKPYTIELYPNKKIDKKKELRKEVGATFLLDVMHNYLGLGIFFERKRTARSFTYNPMRILELLVCDRALHPSSKKRAFELKDRFVKACDFSLDDLYRSLSYLAKHKSALISHMFCASEKALGERNLDQLYYDVTNYHFEIDKEDELRAYGVAKNNKKAPIVQMGLFMDRDGIPISYELFRGNTPDTTTLLPALDYTEPIIEGKRVIVVADKGLNSSQNIAQCILDGNGYVFSQSVRKANEEMKTWVQDERDYISNDDGSFKIKSRQAIKWVYVEGENGKKKKVDVPVKEIAFWSKKYDLRAKHERDIALEKAQKLIDSRLIHAKPFGTKTRYAKDTAYTENGEIVEHKYELDLEKAQEEELLDGYYVIVTSETKLSEKEIIDIYRGLWRIEESFRVLKTDFDARPVNVSTKDHIEAHFLICFIALYVMRIIQKLTGFEYSAATIKHELSEMIGVLLDDRYYSFSYRTDITERLTKLFDLEELNLEVLTKSDLRKVIAKTTKLK